MNEPFNGLTDAQAERLAMLAEEAGEVVQIVGKILRHGYDSYHPEDVDRLTNKIHLQSELTDLWAVMYGMKLANDLPSYLPTPTSIEHAWKRKLKYSHYQGNNE